MAPPPDLDFHGGSPLKGDNGLDGETGAPPLTFLPESFFLGRTEGLGTVRDLAGRQRRCRIITDGAHDSGYDAIHFEETFSYDDGQTDIWRWVMARGVDGRYVASEAIAGPGLIGRIERGDYLIAFNRPARPGGFPSPRFRTRFTLLSPATALKHVQVSLFGLPVASMIAFHTRMSS
jgi:hypothetical protein